MKRSDLEKAVRKVRLAAALLTAVAVIATVAFFFLMFCLTELFINLFTGGWFSWVFPCVATAMAILALLALAIVTGGSNER